LRFTGYDGDIVLAVPPFKELNETKQGREVVALLKYHRVIAYEFGFKCTKDDADNGNGVLYVKCSRRFTAY
jgi:hypothetical protein